MEYFEIENTASEYASHVSARWATFEQAKADMINYSDWYDHKGSGKIYRVTIKVLSDGRIDIERLRVYQA